MFIDGSFLGANVLKIVDGGWITICIATFIATSMITWRDGRALLAKHYSLMRMPAEVFLKDLAEHSPSRTSGTAVFSDRYFSSSLIPKSNCVLALIIPTKP